MKPTFILTISLLLAAQAPRRVPAPAPTPPARFDARPRPRPDEQLLELGQRQLVQYFRGLGGRDSGLARERSNSSLDTGPEVVTTGGTGFGMMALIVAAGRGWVTRAQAAARMSKIVNFLWKTDMYHGAFLHWLNGETGRTIRFGPKDDGADIVETSFLFEGLLCARQYFTRDTPDEANVRSKIRWLWEGVEWSWFTQGGQNVRYWHWSPYGFYDAFSEPHDWVAGSHLAIDQGPIVVMLENARSGVLWQLFMSLPEAQRGLKKLGFESPNLK